MPKSDDVLISAADLRAAIARVNVPLYKIGALVELHPLNLGRILNEKRPLSPELAQKILDALEDHEAVNVR